MLDKAFLKRHDLGADDAQAIATRVDVRTNRRQRVLHQFDGRGRVPVRFMVVLAGLAAAACSSAQITVRSRLADGVVPVQSLMVLQVMQNGGYRGFNGLMYRGFEKRMRADLAACRVRAEIRRGSTSVTTDAAVAEEVRTFDPNAVLKIQALGGDITVTQDQYGTERKEQSDLYFNLELFDLRANNKLTWSVELNLEAEAGTGIADGEKFADAVMAQLRKDGVITTCAD